MNVTNKKKVPAVKAQKRLTMFLRNLFKIDPEFSVSSVLSVAKNSWRKK